MKKTFSHALILSTCLLCTINVLAQPGGKFLNGRKAQEKGWTLFEPGIRIGIGTQSAVFGEFGFALYRNNERRSNVRSEMLFAGAQLIPTLQPDLRQIYGFMAGVETSINQLGLGFESHLETDGEQFDVVLTPKVGFSMMGIVSLYYGFNISLKQYPFANAGNRMLTLSVLLNMPKRTPVGRR